MAKKKAAGRRGKSKPADNHQPGSVLVIPNNLASLCKLASKPARGTNAGRYEAVHLSGHAEEWQLAVTSGGSAVSARGGLAPQAARAALAAFLPRGDGEATAAVDARALGKLLTLSRGSGAYLGLHLSKFKLSASDLHGPATQLETIGCAPLPFSTAIPQGPPQCRAVVSAHRLLALLQALCPCLDPEKDQLYLCFFAPGQPLGLVAVTPEQVTLDGLIMNLDTPDNRAALPFG